MVYFAYNHQVAFVALLAFAAINSDKIFELSNVLKNGEPGVELLMDEILNRNASLYEEIEKHMNCLKTAYVYEYGETAFNEILIRLKSGKLNILNHFYTYLPSLIISCQYSWLTNNLLAWLTYIHA
uniref:Uncharacterized protein n=1 Tax=Trichobilharzia regenti TaxID=157069 RepID=A0AA85JHM1_TRIRE